MRKIKYMIAGILAAGLIVWTTADEGMWMPHQMQELGLKELGLQMDPDDLYRKDGTGLMSAIVDLGGGTAEFVSPEGLLLTNHHVAFGALQRASSRDNDYIKYGFLAKTREEEIAAPGYHADVLIGYDDVTDKVTPVLKPGMTPRERYDALDAVKKKLIAGAEKAGPDIRASVAVMYKGNQYFLYRFKRLKDLRLVYAPPRDLGNYGGDIDNWMWPRHTCDFTFMRAYAAKDGTGVDFSPDNIPYRPKVHIKISLDGFKEDDFSFVMGYPGRTYRNTTVAEFQLDYDMMQQSIKLREELIAFFEKAGEGNRDVQIKYAAIIKSLNNGLKNYQGKLEGFNKVDLLEKKREAQQGLYEWIRSDPKRRKEYGSILVDIEGFTQKIWELDNLMTMFNRLTSPYYSSALLSQAYTITRTVTERAKPDMARDPAYQDRNMDGIRQRIELAERSYDPEVDRALLKFRLNRIIYSPPDEIPKAFKALAGSSHETLDAYVDRLFDNTSLTDPKQRLALLELKPDELVKQGDPLIDLAAELDKEIQALRELEKCLTQEFTDMKKVYLAALLEEKKGRLAPDANSTIRFTYGFLKGYKQRDAVWYDYQTSLGGVLEKETGMFPFNVPYKLKALNEARDFGRYLDERLNDVPACFLNSTSVTGGNSGSPTLNARGEQIGIIFDMTYESVTADYYIIPELQRTISVDIRYVLFITEKFGGAHNIIKELNLD